MVLLSEPGETRAFICRFVFFASLHGYATVVDWFLALRFQHPAIKLSKSNFFSTFSFQLSKLMTVNALLRMADKAMHVQAISIDRGQWSHSRANGGVDLVSVDTCAVPREPTTLTCLAADLSRLPCQQDPRSTNAFSGLWAHAGGQTQRDFSERQLATIDQLAALFAIGRFCSGLADPHTPQIDRLFHGQQFGSARDCGWSAAASLSRMPQVRRGNSPVCRAHTHLGCSSCP